MHTTNNFNDGSKIYIDPDYFATGCDDQLPVLSKIGRGLQGKGVTFEVIKDSDTEYVVRMVDTETGETVGESPNMKPPTIVVRPSVNSDQLVPGEVGHADVIVADGDGTTRAYVIDLPPGADGSTLWTIQNTSNPVMSADNTYIFDFDDLVNAEGSTKTPRVNDLIMLTVFDGTVPYPSARISIGTIVSVNRPSTNVTAYISQGLSVDMPYIGNNGNWFLGSLDTLTPATGATFTPSVDDNGNLSWTNDRGLANPATKNITGPTIQVMTGEYREPGSTKDLPDLPAFADTSEGTAYIVDDDEIDGQLDLYIHGANGTDWTIVDNWGGVPGAKGDKGDPGSIESLNVSKKVIVTNFLDGKIRRTFIKSGRSIILYLEITVPFYIPAGTSYAFPAITSDPDIEKLKATTKIIGVPISVTVGNRSPSGELLHGHIVLFGSTNGVSQLSTSLYADTDIPIGTNFSGVFSYFTENDIPLPL